MISDSPTQQVEATKEDVQSGHDSISKASISDMESHVAQLTKELADVRKQLRSALKRAEKAERQYGRTLSYNDDLRKQVDDLSRELHQYKNRGPTNTHQATQTVDYQDQHWGTSGTALSYSGSEVAGATNGQDGSLNLSTGKVDLTTEDSGTSLAECLRATAEAALQDTGFVYDENTGMYYDSISGYFYDNENSLYFDPPSGTYFYYDEASAEYKFHSQVDMSAYYASQSNDTSGFYDNSATGYTHGHQSQETGKGSKGVKKKHKDRSDREGKKNKHGALKKARKDKQGRECNNDSDEQANEKMDVGKEEESEFCRNNISCVHSGKDARCKVDQMEAESESCEPPCSHRTSRPKASRAFWEEATSCSAKKDCIEDKTHSETADCDNTKTECQKQNDCWQQSDTNCDSDVGSDSESELESGELTESELSSLDSEEDCVEISDQTSEIVEESNPCNYPPCIRVMVTESEVVDPGSLFVITYPGGSIGREGSHVILLPEINVSKIHAEICYCEPDRNYVIVDKGSQNGTFINGTRIAEPKSVGEPRLLNHGDRIKVGSSILLCHIHAGLDTCDQCEPGQVLANLHSHSQSEKDVVILSKEEKEKLRRRQLKDIKRKYGLDNADYEGNKSALNNPSYSDKAEERRKTKGSDNPYQKSEAPASVHKPISAVNKGHKMLEKMGWTEGKSLGKDNTGICEPVKVSFRVNKSAGLGSSLGRQTDLDNANSTRSNQIWLKTQQRFRDLEDKSPRGPSVEPSVLPSFESTADFSCKIKPGNTVNLVTKKSKTQTMNWVQGETLEFNETSNTVSHNSDGRGEKSS
ncbi:angiogenic factor with G patch and FHA domains 1-like [Liolophura sinensis]|uniref:angiogenic factor with G patch and FHA domains 1-like n=1 Tax=Liolophura sinensis TaxID=3198878 RepID=UPI0031590517